MLRRTISHLVVVCMAFIFLHMAVPLKVFAQAGVPEKGAGSVTTTYQKVDVRYHYTSTGLKQDRGSIHTHNTVTALEYGLTDRLAMDFDLTFVSSKYQGDRPHGPPDNGSFHPTVQDVHLDLRYNLLARPLMLTPFVGVTIPTHDYEVRGHSAVGRGFKEFLIGVNVGRQLGPVLPKAYFQVRYSFAAHKRFAGLSLNRSNAEWEVGWWANKSITLRLVGSLQKTHGGFDFPQDLHGPDEFDIHDRVAKANYVQLGGGVTYSVNRFFDIHVAYAPTPIYARNTHGDRGMVIGFTWSFSRGISSGRIATNNTSGRVPSPAQGMF